MWSGERSKGVKRAVLTGSAIILFLYLPFLNKAVHIDDGNFIEMAKTLKFPFSVESGHRYYFMGRKVDSYMPFDSTHPPLLPFYLKTVMTLTGGEKEYLLHASFLVFPLILLFSALRLARELGVEPLPAAAAICGSVLLLPVGHNLMADAPMFSLLVFSAYLFLSGIREDHSMKVLGASLALTISGLLSYQAFLFLPSFLLYALALKRTGPRILLALSLPAIFLCMVLAYIGLNFTSPVSGIFGEIARGLVPERLFNKGLSIAVIAGAASVFFIPLRISDILAGRKYMIAAPLCLVLVIPPVMGLSYPLPGSAGVAFFAAAGLFALFFIFAQMKKDEWRSEEWLFLLSWTVTVIIYNIFLMPFGSLRYMVPVILPVTFVFMKNVKDLKRLAASAACTALLGLGVAYGDYLYASSYRDFAKEVTKTAGKAHDRIWYVGEWGMHYYMDRQGFNYLTADSNEPKMGDLIIFAEVPKLWNPSLALYQRMQLIDVREVTSQYPIRVMGMGARAGHYSTLWGYLPFSFSTYPIERFGVFRVVS